MDAQLYPKYIIFPWKYPKNRENAIHNLKYDEKGLQTRPNVGVCVYDKPKHLNSLMAGFPLTAFFIFLLAGQARA